MTTDHNGLTACPHARRYDLTGCHIAAIVLERLTYWWKRGTRQMYGVQWRAKPRDQLCSELRLSLKQVTNALVLLKRRHLIETSQHKFGEAGRAVMHYRLLPRSMVLFEGFKPAPKNEEPHALQGTPGYAPQGTPLYMAAIEDVAVIPSFESTNVDSPENCEQALAEPTASGLKSGFEGSSSPKKVKETAMFSSKKSPSPQSPPPQAKPKLSAAEMIASKKLTGSFPGKAPKKPAATLADIWRETYLANYPGAFLTPFTMKQLGQLKQFGAKVVGAGADPATIVRLVVSQWWVFKNKASSEAGAFAIPSKPDVAVALRFVNVAANLKPEEKVSVAQGNEKFIAQLIAQGAGAASPSKGPHVKASPEEFAAIVGGPVKKKD